jgi:penicillin-binding protein 1C
MAPPLIILRGGLFYCHNLKVLMITRKKKLLRWFLVATAAILGAAVLGIYFLSRSLPSIEEINSREITQSTKILDRTGTVLLYEISAGGQKRTVIPQEDIPRALKDATVAIEDERFYQEPAFDWRGIVRSVFVNFTTGQYTQGASTITQQLARNAFLTPEKTIVRKLKELLLAVRLDKYYPKDKILWLYLNEIPYGPSLYGVEAASQAYFAKSAKDLDLAESALLASIPKAPTYYSPSGTHVTELLRRKDLVLQKMLSLGKISQKNHDEAVKEKIEFQPQFQGIKAPHFVMAVQDYLVQKYGEEMVRKGGLKVITTLDWNLQQMAERAVEDGVTRNEKLYAGTNGALVAQSATSGQVLAMVGSKDYFDVKNDGNFNVATQGLRQPGSALKPFIYLNGFTKGYTPDTVLFDVSTEFASNNPSCPAVPDYASDTGDKGCFHPQDFEGYFQGPLSVRSALAESVNIPAVKMLYLTGIKSSVDLINSFGVSTLDNPDRYGLSLVWGGGAVHLNDLTEAYSVLADDGVRHAQSIIFEAKDSSGNVLESWVDQNQRLIDSQPVREINDILSDASARAPLFQASQNLTVFPGYDVALKTGTSNDYRDAWAFGYTPFLVVGVWAGNNDNSPMHRQGSSILAAVPIWSAFLNQALKTVSPDGFPRPDPWGSEKPILRGQYFIDGQVHSILYYVDKNNPVGAQPENPSNDPQFSNWETGVLAWAVKNPDAFSSAANAVSASLPPSPVFYGGPNIQFLSPQNGSFVTDSISLRAQLSSGSALFEANIYWNQVLLSSQRLMGSSAEINSTFSPSFIDQQNLLEVETKDSSGRSLRSGIILYKQT